MSGVVDCPECLAGKHQNCDGSSWDVEADGPTMCPCAGRNHGEAARFVPEPVEPQTLCGECGAELRRSPDPRVPWVHIETANEFCDVTGVADAVIMAGTPNRRRALPTRPIPSVRLLSETRLPDRTPPEAQM